MQGPMTCALCGKPIEAGEAWMQSDEGGARRVAHAGCVYRDEHAPAERARWLPNEGRAGGG
jgi:hypothetical protein